MDFTFNLEPITKENITVVRLTTEYYKQGSAYKLTKKLTPLKRKSKGFNILDNEIAYELEGLTLINNLQYLVDGVYELVYSDKSVDYETGYTEYESYSLVPYEENNYED